MYAVDDAVAKVDGYIISVTDGGAHVGEKRLARIEEAGRSSATAVLVEDQPPSGNGAADKSVAKPAVKAAAKAAVKDDDEKPAPRSASATTVRSHVQGRGEGRRRAGADDEDGALGRR